MADSRFIALILLPLFMLTGAAAGASVGFDQSAVTVMPGETIAVNLTLDNASDGLTGYSILLSMEDPSIGEIAAVTLPGWAGLPEITGVPGPEVGIKTVDLNNEVQKGSARIILATITVKGFSPGTTEISLAEPKFDNDIDTRFTPALSNVSIIVTTEVSTLPSVTNATAAATTTATATATTGGSVVSGGSGGG